MTDIRNVLLSIKPEFAEKIFSGEKEIEFRKKIWKNYKFLSVIEVQKIYLYITAPVKRIQGYFKYHHVVEGNPAKLWKRYNCFSGITEKEFKKYFGYANFEYQTKIAFGIRIQSTVEFKTPLNPRQLSPGFHPPQNYCYLNDVLGKKLSQIEKEASYFKNILLNNFSQTFSDLDKKDKKEGTKSWKI